MVEKVMLMDGKNIYLMDRNLNILSKIIMQNTTFCSSYLTLQDKYLVLCDKTFLLMDSYEIKAVYFHKMTVDYQTRNDF